LRPLARGSGGIVRPGAAEILIGLVGRGIELSRTPSMHEREGARLGMAYTYALIDFDTLALPDAALGAVIDAAVELGFVGLNVTHPFKQSVIRHLTGLTADAKSIGAVNTVVLREGQRAGHNTDRFGFLESFKESMAGCPLSHVALFGAGGAGAAVAYALMELGVAKLTIVDAEPERAHVLAARMTHAFGPRVEAAENVARCLDQADGIVNATPIGMARYPGMPFRAGLLAPRHWVAEIIYFPETTELLARARALGCRTLDGTGMAVHQAVRAFELFTGVAPDPAAMAGHFAAARLGVPGNALSAINSQQGGRP
jgi:shikimate dehydrogenase